MPQDKREPITAEDIAELFEKPKIHTAQLGEQHFTIPEPIRCKHCGSLDIMKRGFREGIQEYICQKCGKKFIDKDTPYGMRTEVRQIGASLKMFYDGLSLADISRHLDEVYKNPVSRSTVYRWIIKYTIKALDLLEPLKPSVGDTFVVDETVIKVSGGNWWLWDVIDDDTRFLLASHLSETRAIHDVMTLMHRTRERAGKNPRFIISDALGFYPDGIERIFGADAKHIQARGLTHEINTNLIERFQGTIKERTKVLRGFKTLDTAELILDGFMINYDFFRPHMSLSNRTPAELAKIKSPIKSWTELVRQSHRASEAKPVNTPKWNKTYSFI